MKTLLQLTLLTLLSLQFVYATNPDNPTEPEVKWITWEEAVELSKTEKRPIIVDLYTDWCGWCKKMDKDTYTNEELVDYINSNYYAVKLNAEQREAISFKGNEFKFVAQGRKGFHELAYALTDGKLSYPTTVFLTGDFERLHVQPGYLTPGQISPIVKYFNEGFPDKTFEEFSKEG